MEPHEADSREIQWESSIGGEQEEDSVMLQHSSSSQQLLPLSYTFNETFDSSLTTMLTSFLTLDECLVLLKLNKQFNKYMSGEVDFIWKKQFEYEFHLQEYPDHQKTQDETYFEFFKRSFGRYKHVRSIMREMFTLTKDINSEAIQGEYLRPFTQRKLAPLMELQTLMSFEYECLYKNLNDPAEIHDYETLISLQNFSPFERFQNFPIHVTEFYEHRLEFALLSPAAVTWIQMILLQYYKKKLLPLVHTTAYRHSVFVDVENQFGHGPNALISWGGPDRTKIHLVGTSIFGFLQDHLQRLRDRYFFDKKGRIESFPSDPKQMFGSVTITNGVRIEAVAKYIHFFSVFDTTHYHRPKYYFAYQIRMSVDEQTSQQNQQSQPFYKCQLTRRHWDIKMGSQVEREDGDGVERMYPVLSTDMVAPFVYESCCPVSQLGSTISGWFEFKYLEGPQEGQTFTANVAPFAMYLDPGTQLIDNPFFEPWMHF